MSAPFVIPMHAVYSAPFIKLKTSQGEGWFLIDTGLPTRGFTFHKGLRVEGGPQGLYPDRATTLETPPFQYELLDKLRKLTGLPVSGMIGAQYFKEWGGVMFDYERAELRLSDRLDVEPYDQLVEMPSPFSVKADINGHVSRCHVDTGSLFNVSHGAPQPSQYSLSVPSFMGDLKFDIFRAPISVSTVQAEPIQVRCAVTCDAPAPVQILGSEWLTSFAAVGFDFVNKRLALRAKPSTMGLSANPGSYQYAPPFVAHLNPEELNQEGRGFTIEPLPHGTLPEGLSRDERYQVKGAPLPAGPGGANELFRALYSQEPAEVTLTCDEGERVVTLRAMWSTEG